MADFLNDIAHLTRQRVDALMMQVPLSELKKKASRAEPRRGFAASLRHKGQIAVIAELKQSSPSLGVIRQETHIESRIEAYARGGASALSILTEETYFAGSPELLARARKVVTLPLLRKDFILDPYQIYESRHLGADGVLFIVAMLPGSLLKDFIHHAEDAQIDPLVEIHDERELDQALESGAKVIGINNRDLRSLKVDPGTSERVVPRIPKDRTIVIESGVKDPADLTRFKSWGAHAVLIGEALMRSPEPENAVRTFVQAGAL